MKLCTPTGKGSNAPSADTSSTPVQTSFEPAGPLKGLQEEKTGAQMQSSDTVKRVVV